ncbi:MAG TPA: RNA methyltransferase [bacterium]|nr:RNA methyltransferase [bacterium]
MRSLARSGVVITSRGNPFIRDLRALLRSPHREADRVAVEGWRALAAAASAGARFEAVVYTPDAAGDARYAPLRRDLQALGAREVLVARDVFAAVAQVETPQGALGIARRPAPASPSELDRPDALLVVLDAVQDPGNVGAILRTAAAVGATGAVTVGGAADPFGAKALRASAGTAFRMPLLHAATAATAAEELRRRGVRLLVAAPRGGRLVAEASFDRPLAMIFGNEGAGADAAWWRAGAEAVRLPIADGVESLNVAAAAAILLYRAAGLS